VVDLVQSQKGNQVSRIYDVDVSTASPRPRRDDAARPAPRAGAAPRSPYGNDRGGYGGGGYGNDRYGSDRGASSGPSEEVEGTVKWFNTTKGFGFVAPDNGGKDVFVHVTAVERSGVGPLAENQRVRMKVQQGQKGLEAVSIETL
jgi:CspA family cold shock protein